MITVHHLGMSQSERIVWLCEEFEIAYDLKIYKREANGMAPRAYKALHPQGTAPIITEGSLALAETGAIVEYILAREGGGRLAVGPQSPDFAAYLYWFHYANATFMAAAVMSMMAARSADGDSQRAQVYNARLDAGYRMIEERLSAAPYFAGAGFTAADIMMVFPLTTMRVFTGRTLDATPHLRAYLKRIGERPAYRRAMHKGDPEMTPHLE
jgi:glutathione S-transferase